MACEIQRKVPTMLCTRVMPRFSSFGAVGELLEYWNLAPYVGASHLWGEHWGSLGMGCWKCSKSLLTELGMEMLTYFFGVVPIDGQSE